MKPGDEVEWHDEPSAYPYERVQLPPRERTRRGFLVGMTITFVGVFLLQLAFAMVGGDLWTRVGPVLSSVGTLVGTGFGYALGHYFSGKD